MLTDEEVFALISTEPTSWRTLYARSNLDGGGFEAAVERLEEEGKVVIEEGDDGVTIRRV
jgi:hypothetical protein